MVASSDPQRVVGGDGFPEGSPLGKCLDAKIAPFTLAQNPSSFPFPETKVGSFSQVMV